MSINNIDRNELKLLFILVLSSFNHYISTVAFLVLAVIQLFFVKKRKFYKEEKKILLYYFLFITIGFSSALAHATPLLKIFVSVAMFSGFMTFPYVTNTIIKKINVFSVIDKFLNIQIIVSILQYISLAIKTRHINIFNYSMAAGDHIKGTFENSTLFCIFLAFSFFIFFHNNYKNKKNIVILVLIIITSANANMLIFAIVASICAIFNLIRLKKIKQLIIIIIIFVFGINFYAMVQPSNTKYMVDILTSSATKNKPRKLQAYEISLNNYFNSNWEIPFLGLGVGNYNSRTAMIFSNEYLNLPVKFGDSYTTDFTRDNILPLWNKKLLSQQYQDGIANQPFSQIISILFEVGITGFLAILFLVLEFFKIEVKNKKWFFSFFSPLLFLGFLFLDNYLEYMSFSMTIWLTIYYFTSLIKQRNFD